LVFNEGYSASFGPSLTRADLSGEAIRLGRLLVQLLPEPEVTGLLALMLLHESRRPARTSANGDLVLLEQQDLSSKRIGPYTLQAAIAAVHAEASSAEQTDWAQ
jgi:RNA polymerase sigma-70 factor (ECF subfamily)